MSKDTIIGNGAEFDRTYRITGYTVKFNRANDAKKQEILDRVQHEMTCECKSHKAA